MRGRCSQVAALVLVCWSVLLLVAGAQTPRGGQQPHRQQQDNGSRSERSANLSHITGTSRKIQMVVRNRFLQLLPDGSVDGSWDEGSDYTILQRTSISAGGRMKIQGVATCLFLCMDSCGLLYGSREFTDDCILNETIEQTHYNTYSSVRYSNARRTLYLALNKRGIPRKVQIRANMTLGKLSVYTRVLTQTVTAARVESLATRLLGANHNGSSHSIRHHGLSQRCFQLQEKQKQDQLLQQQQHRKPNAVAANKKTELADVNDERANTGDKFRCRRRKKRKKKKKKKHRCQNEKEEDEEEGGGELDEEIKNCKKKNLKKKQQLQKKKKMQQRQQIKKKKLLKKKVGKLKSKTTKTTTTTTAVITSTTTSTTTPKIHTSTSLETLLNTTTQESTSIRPSL